MKVPTWRQTVIGITTAWSWAMQVSVTSLPLLIYLLARTWRWWSRSWACPTCVQADGFQKQYKGTQKSDNVFWLLLLSSSPFKKLFLQSMYSLWFHITSVLFQKRCQEARASCLISGSSYSGTAVIVLDRMNSLFSLCCSNEEPCQETSLFREMLMWQTWEGPLENTQGHLLTLQKRTPRKTSKVRWIHVHACLSFSVLYLTKVQGDPWSEDWHLQIMASWTSWSMHLIGFCRSETPETVQTLSLNFRMQGSLKGQFHICEHGRAVG